MINKIKLVSLALLVLCTSAFANNNPRRNPWEPVYFPEHRYPYPPEMHPNMPNHGMPIIEWRF
jgi:hypothetical protein